MADDRRLSPENSPKRGQISGLSPHRLPLPNDCWPHDLSGSESQSVLRYAAVALPELKKPARYILQIRFPGHARAPGERSTKCARRSTLGTAMSFFRRTNCKASKGHYV